MNVFVKLWKSMFGQSSWTHPDSVAVKPPSYRSQVRDSYWHAVAALNAKGIQTKSHNIEKVDIRNGTVKRNAGWSLPCSASPTGFAGGWRESKRLVVVCDPKTGDASSAIMAHEWAHVLMDRNGDGPYGTELQHQAMRSCGLM